MIKREISTSQKIAIAESLQEAWIRQATRSHVLTTHQGLTSDEVDGMKPNLEVSCFKTIDGTDVSVTSKNSYDLVAIDTQLGVTDIAVSNGALNIDELSEVRVHFGDSVSSEKGYEITVFKPPFTGIEKIIDDALNL